MLRFRAAACSCIIAKRRHPCHGMTCSSHRMYECLGGKTTRHTHTLSLRYNTSLTIIESLFSLTSREQSIKAKTSNTRIITLLVSSARTATPRQQYLYNIRPTLTRLVAHAYLTDSALTVLYCSVLYIPDQPRDDLVITQKTRTTQHVGSGPTTSASSARKRQRRERHGASASCFHGECEYQ